MQFITIASALFAAALAAPAPQTSDCPNPAHCGGPDDTPRENIDISDYYLRKNDGIQSISFKLSGDNATNIDCSIGPVPTLPSEVVTCGESDYRFGVIESPNGQADPGLILYHQTAPL